MDRLDLAYPALPGTAVPHSEVEVRTVVDEQHRPLGSHPLQRAALVGYRGIL